MMVSSSAKASTYGTRRGHVADTSRTRRGHVADMRLPVCKGADTPEMA